MKIIALKKSNKTNVSVGKNENQSDHHKKTAAHLKESAEYHLKAAARYRLAAAKHLSSIGENR
jgi:hypothetical protein